MFPVTWVPITFLNLRTHTQLVLYEGRDRHEELLVMIRGHCTGCGCAYEAYMTKPTLSHNNKLKHTHPQTLVRQDKEWQGEETCQRSRMHNAPGQTEIRMHMYTNQRHEPSHHYIPLNVCKSDNNGLKEAVKKYHSSSSKWVYGLRLQGWFNSANAFI